MKVSCFGRRDRALRLQECHAIFENAVQLGENREDERRVAGCQGRKFWFVLLHCESPECADEIWLELENSYCFKWLIDTEKGSTKDFEMTCTRKMIRKLIVEEIKMRK